MLTIDHHGPFEYLILEFPGDHVGEEALSVLAELATPGAVRILDLVYLHRDAAGEVTWYEADEPGSPDPDASALFEEDRCDLLNDSDLEAAAELLGLGTCGCLVVIENVWESRLADAVRGIDGRVALDERCSEDQVVAALQFAADSAD